MSAPPSVSPLYRPPGKPVDVRKILRRHYPFFVAVSFALAGLVAIEAWGVAQFAPPLPAGELWLWGIAAVLVTYAGNALAFLLTSQRVRPEKYPRPVGAFAAAAGQGMALTAITFVLVFLLLLKLVSFNLDLTVVLLKDIYFYALVAVALLHGLVYYVRQMHWLYEEFGGADSALKPIAASGGIGALILIITLFLLPLDLQTITNAPPELRGVTGLFIYGRDIYLITLALAAYAWHFRWIADH